MAKGWIIVAVVLIVVFFFVPIVPYTSSTSSAFGLASTQVTGQVSPSFYIFGCGLVLDVRGTGSVFGIQVRQSSTVSGFFCNIGTQR